MERFAGRGRRLQIDSLSDGARRYPTRLACRVSERIEIWIYVDCYCAAGRKSPRQLLFYVALDRFSHHQYIAVAVWFRCEDRDAFAAQARPWEAGCGFPERRARIVKGKNVAVIAALGSHFIGSALAEANAVTFAASVKHNAIRVVFDFVALAAQRVPAQRPPQSKTEGTGADERSSVVSCERKGLIPSRLRSTHHVDAPQWRRRL